MDRSSNPEAVAMIRWRWSVLLGLSTTVLMYGVIRYGATLPSDWNICVAVLAVAAIFFGLFCPATCSPPVSSWLKWPLSLFLLYVAFQILPVPVGVLRWLSPNRMRVLEGLAAVGRRSDYATISVSPSLTFVYLVRIASYATLFFLIRALAWNGIKYAWLVAFPIMATGVVEGALGLIQYGMFDVEFATGTYMNRNHFAGLLEMALPFFVMYAVVLFRGTSKYRSWLNVSTVSAYAALSLAAMILLSLVCSFSRMGLTSSAASLLLLFFLSKRETWSRVRKAVVALALFALLPISVMLLSPARMVQRFAQQAANGDPAAELRPQLWIDTMHLIRDYPLFGCGLGAFGNTFLKYQTVSPGWSYPYAHNDYLQLVAELGLIGTVFPIALMIAVYIRAWRATSTRYEHRSRYLAIASVGALTALALHSFTDFNTYVPANAMALTWIAGFSSVLLDSKFKRRTSRDFANREESSPVNKTEAVA